jgi:hypothetical protein
MTPEERRRKQREVLDAFGQLSDENRSKLLRYAEHLAMHKRLGSLYLGENMTGEGTMEPACWLLYLN